MTYGFIRFGLYSARVSLLGWFVHFIPVPHPPTYISIPFISPLDTFASSNHTPAFDIRDIGRDLLI